MMDKKVSVIVPCYNLEKIISRCLDSLCAQTYSNLEIIVVDDGSKDQSFQKIQTYAQKDSRIVPICQKNQGVSAARNHAMDVATGDYLMFVDGDDYVADTYVEHFVEATQGCQLVISGLRYVYSDGSEATVYEGQYCCDKAEYVEKHYLQSIENRSLFGPVIKLYDRQLIEQYKIRFEEDVHIHEDSIFVMQVLKHVQRLRGIPYMEYYYVQHAPDTSLVSKFQPNEIQINNRYFEMMISVIGKDKLRDADIRCIYAKYLHIDIATVRKLYRSRDYNLRNGLRYIYKLLHDETFRYARRELRRVAPRQAMKFYRPLIMVHAINYLAVKLKK